LGNISWNEELLGQVNEEEVKVVMKAMKKKKGPDGVPVEA